MKISIEKAKQMLTDLFRTSGASEEDVQTMVMLRMEYDFHQNTFSGFDGIERNIRRLNDSISKKQLIVVDKPAMKLINANGRYAGLVGMDVCKLVSEMAKENGMGFVGIFNSTYHGILETYAREIASNDLVAFVSANGGAQGTVPYGGKKDILGTNPLALGIPSNNLPIIFDGATAKYAYGTIGLAKERNQQLPEKSYLDKNGNFTTDPSKAYSIVPFGEHKGYAINLWLEVMTGLFVRAKSGLEQKSGADSDDSELGSFFMAFDPSVFQPIDEFKTRVSRLIADIESVEPIEGVDAVYVPGIRSEREKLKMLKEGTLEIEDRIWQEFETTYKRIIGHSYD